jgi:hypothetical protein
VRPQLARACAPEAERSGERPGRLWCGVAVRYRRRLAARALQAVLRHCSSLH